MIGKQSKRNNQATSGTLKRSIIFRIAALLTFFAASGKSEAQTHRSQGGRVLTDSDVEVVNIKEKTPARRYYIEERAQPVQYAAPSPCCTPKPVAKPRPARPVYVSQTPPAPQPLPPPQPAVVESRDRTDHQTVHIEQNFQGQAQSGDAGDKLELFDLRARLRDAERRADAAERRAERMETKARDYRARLTEEKDKVAKINKCCDDDCPKSDCEERRGCCRRERDGASGFYLGLVVGAGPDGVSRSYEAEPDYGIVDQQYRPFIGLRLMGVSSGGFAVGAQATSNAAVSVDFNVKLN